MRKRLFTVRINTRLANLRKKKKLTMQEGSMATRQQGRIRETKIEAGKHSVTGKKNPEGGRGFKDPSQGAYHDPGKGTRKKLERGKPFIQGKNKGTGNDLKGFKKETQRELTKLEG